MSALATPTTEMLASESTDTQRRESVRLHDERREYLSVSMDNAASINGGSLRIDVGLNVSARLTSETIF